MKEAVEQYEETIRIQPNHVLALSGLALIKKEQGKLEEAVELCQKALEVRYGKVGGGEGVCSLKNRPGKY